MANMHSDVYRIKNDILFWFWVEHDRKKQKFYKEEQDEEIIHKRERRSRRWEEQKRREIGQNNHTITLID